MLASLRTKGELDGLSNGIANAPCTGGSTCLSQPSAPVTEGPMMADDTRNVSGGVSATLIPPAPAHSLRRRRLSPFLHLDLPRRTGVGLSSAVRPAAVRVAARFGQVRGFARSATREEPLGQASASAICTRNI